MTVARGRAGLFPDLEAILKATPTENVLEARPMARGPAESPADLGSGFRSPLTLALVSCGGIGALLFTATYLIEGVTRPGYDAWRQPISALSLGPGGWVQRVNFVLFGVLLVLSAVGWYRFLAPEPYAIWFTLPQGIAGLGLIGAGVFSMDPFPGYPPGAPAATSTVHGTLHSILAYALIICLAQSCFVWVALFARLPHWRVWAAYSGITGVLILVFWGMFVRYPTASTAGLVERLSAGSHALWLCLLTGTLLVQHRTRSRESAEGVATL